ncbi:anaerobic glycerol-3-phosphate dehydrogenase subunit C [Neomoorella thermoacetica]|uniref:anaerobic glycerol-3-phosphate dehydrogenase subunit C n=1 Tax=Neomoorella thermoacetica TaxID=1525 RepID=UPI0030D621AA
MKQLEKMLDFCLKCNICYTQCPVVKKEINFPGPKYLGPELARLWLVGDSIEENISDQELSCCTNCQRCNLACPHGVKPAYFNLKHKTRLVLPLRERARDWLLANNYLFGALGKALAPMINTFIKSSLLRRLLPALGISRQRPLPLYDKRQIKLESCDKASAKKAVYFIGCYASYFDTDVARATINLLKYVGYQVEIAPLKCCGTPLLSNGFLKQARRLAEINVARLLDYVDRGFKVVTSCPSCSLALKEEYNELFAVEGSRKLAAWVWDIGELLAIEGIHAQIKESIYYHVPCHLQAQGIGLPFARIIEKVDNMMINNELCCGMAGTFGYKKEKYKLSMEIGNGLFHAIKQSRCQYIITDCGMCKWQIQHGTGFQVLHPVQIIERWLS